MKEQVLVLIKPDGSQKGLTGIILDRFLSKGLELKAIKTVKVTDSLAKKHYSLLKEKPFFKDIVQYLMGKFHGESPVIAMVFEGEVAVKHCRDIAGATNPEEANPHSIRGSFGRITTEGLWENTVHVSSNREESQREIALWFSAKEIMK